jgi:phosphate transport system substrate-binding protein
MLKKSSGLMGQGKLMLFVLTISILWGLSASVLDTYAGTRETILRLHGSNTIGAKLAPDMAETFLKKLGASTVKREEIIPNTEINLEGFFPDKNLTRIIEIKAHGSSTGFKGLKTAQCDIGMASRKIKKKETDSLAFLGDMTGIACEHVLALDGVAVIVNIANDAIAKLDVHTLGEIFCGRITDWAQLGGKSGPIAIYARDEKSGTHDTFKSLVLGKRCSLSSSAKRFDSNRILSDAVSQDPNAIGYCGLPYVQPNKVLAISNGGPAIRPTVFTIATEDYPLTRRLHFYTPAVPRNPYTRNYIAFALGREGQAHVSKHKFVPLTIKATDYTVEIKYIPQNRNVLDKYLEAVSGAKRLSTSFRFKTSKFELDTRAIRDLERMIDYLLENKAEKVILTGFADNRGDYWTNHKLSCNRAQAVKEEFYSRGISVHDVLCVSEEVPVASNETPSGRAKNRRVEVWIK